MADKKTSRTVNVVLRRADNRVKIAVIAVILCSILALIALRLVHNGLVTQTEKLRSAAAEVEATNSALEELTQNPDAVQTVQEIASQELGLVDPGTVIIEPIS